MLIFKKHFILYSVFCMLFSLAQYLSQPKASHPSSYPSNLQRDKTAKIEPSVGWLSVVVVVASTVWRSSPISPSLGFWRGKQFCHHQNAKEQTESNLHGVLQQEV
eukprot:TRINITY_DN5559_c0_g1_i1.p1 TRINITY_DN5559_c0_g1~~TRINITY_DN5559_c0_g1_i1.p1  ORF type:complete len:105 (-),score=19.21 TRINITY_DN5559_c0_g1_i1:14-328(-)